jgi:hypothetical protein
MLAYPIWVKALPGLLVVSFALPGFEGFQQGVSKIMSFILLVPLPSFPLCSV